MPAICEICVTNGRRGSPERECARERPLLEAFGCPERKGAESASVLFFYRSVVAWECLELIEKDFQGVARHGHIGKSRLFVYVGCLFNIGSYRLRQKAEFVCEYFEQ